MELLVILKSGAYFGYFGHRPQHGVEARGIMNYEIKDMKPEEMKYSEAIAELEAITAKMQSADCDIDSLASLTSRALDLLKVCKEKLFKTDQEVKKCLETLSDSLEA